MKYHSIAFVGYGDECFLMGDDYVVTPKRLSMNFDAPWWSASHSMSEMLPRNKISLYSVQKSLDCGVDNRTSNATCISC